MTAQAWLILSHASLKPISVLIFGRAVFSYFQTKHATDWPQLDKCMPYVSPHSNSWLILSYSTEFFAISWSVINEAVSTHFQTNCSTYWLQCWWIRAFPTPHPPTQPCLNLSFAFLNFRCVLATNFQHIFTRLISALSEIVIMVHSKTGAHFTKMRAGF